MSNVTSCISLEVSATEFAITAMVAMVYFFLSEHRNKGSAPQLCSHGAGDELEEGAETGHVWIPHYYSNT